jgi:hypothetical protein
MGELFSRPERFDIPEASAIGLRAKSRDLITSITYKQNS